MRLRMFLAIGLLTAPLSPVFVFPSASYGQEATDVPDTTAEDVAEVEPEVLAVPDEIRQLLKEGKPAEAAEVLEAAMQSDAVAEALKPFHQTIATGFVRARQYDKAMEQFGAAVEFELARTDSPAAAEQLSSLIRQVSVYGLHAAQPELAAEWSDKAIEKVRALEAEHPIEIQRPLSRLIQVRASMLARDDEEAAKEMLAKQVAKLEDINATEDRSEKTYVELINLLTAQARLFEDEDGQDRVASAFEVALEAIPNRQS